MNARSILSLLLGAVLVAACAGAPAPTNGPPIDSPAQPTPDQPTPAGATPEQPTPGQPTPGQPTPAQPTAAPPTAEPTAPPLAAAQLAWTELASSDGPSAREDHTFTLDSGGDYGYLFGGRAGQRAFDDLWRYDLAQDAWQLLEPVGARPEARFGHVAVWVESHGLVIWSGQQSATVFFGDTWAFDPAASTWRQLPDAGDVPPARYGSCGSIGPDGRLWISHGFTADTGRFFDTRAYDFATLSWTDMTPDGDLPVSRCLHDCLWTPDGELVLYAGQTTGAPAIGDLWRYSAVGGTWTEGPPPAAEPRQLYALAELSGTAFIFGGGSRDGGFLDDLWLLDLATLEMAPATVEGGPSARFGAALLADAQRNRLLLFGGKGQAGEVGDVWQLSAAGQP